ncbi:3-hydroxyisobutyryl-CoA hydrolase 1-like protein [Tanacetum coccineum]|uniref:3-hydroxyisobutyryl-CoA hydrolase 1-like protein n=1 Tax=Tanacetum coccineum TaxID=301880 RepID=A0ABQ5H5R7_9ASTR
MREYLQLLRQNKQNGEVLPDFDDVEEYGYDEDEEVGNGSQKGRRKFQAQPSKKQKGVKGPMDMFFTPPPEQVVKNRKDGKMKQSTVNEICKKELQDKACKELANWFYDAGLPFNAVNHDSFRIPMEAVAQHGTVHHKQWAKYGCSLMSDGWRDSVAHKDIINFLVNSPRGSVFVREQNVVQVVTDNASNYKAAGKLLMAKSTHLYWTPCVAHCIDLMLEDIGKIQRVRQTLKRAMTLNGYIYNRTGVVNMMRKFTRKRELLRPATTRFATAYITLRSIQVQKMNLRKMFTSNTWTKSKYAKEQAGKHVAGIVAMPTFWSSYGNEVPILKKFAIKVLSLTCSATGCERNWSIFSLLHNKRRNRLDQARLNDLVYVKYNRQLKKRFDRRDLIDPLLLNDIDESNEWLIGRMYEDELPTSPSNDQSNIDESNYNLRSNDEVVVLENSDTEEEDIEEDERDHNEEGYTFDDDDDDVEFGELD